MLENLIRGLRLICLALAIVVSLQVYRLTWGASPEGDDLIALPASDERPNQAPSRSGSPAKEGDGEGNEEGDGAPASSLPERYAPLTSSGLFGKSPPQKPPPPPALLGLMGGREKKYAILKGGDGKSFRLAAGEEKNGVKLLRVGTNRVVIEYLEKEIELSLFSGLGGKSLLDARKD